MTFRLSPNSPKRKAARSGTAPYSLIARVPRWRVCKGGLLVYFAARSGTAPYNLIARLLCGAFGDRALQPRCSSTLRRVRGPRPRAVIPIMMWIPKSGAFGDRALQPRQPCGTVGNRSLQPRCSLLVARCSSLFPSRRSFPIAPRPSPVFPSFPLNLNYLIT